METNIRVLGEEHPDTLTSMANLALTCLDQGRWKQAEELDVRVMETRKRVLGEEHPVEYVQRNWPSATDLLSLMSFFDRQGIPESLIRNRARTEGGCGSQSQLDQNKEREN